MKRLELKEATDPLLDYVQEAKHEPLIVTVRGKPVAALVPIEGMDWESLNLSTSPEFIDLIERSRARLKAEGGISSEEMRRELGLPCQHK